MKNQVRHINFVFYLNFRIFWYNSHVMKRKTIRNHKDFITPRDCAMARCAFCAIKTKPAKIQGDARYGIVVSKKFFKLATQRNRAKRLLRDWIAFNEDLMIADLDYVFIANESVLESNRDCGRVEIKKAFEKISKQYGK